MYRTELIKLLVVLFIFISILELKAQKTETIKAISSAQGKIEQILIASKLSFLNTNIELIEAIKRNRKAGDTLIVYVENKNKQLSNKIDFKAFTRKFDEVKTLNKYDFECRTKHKFDLKKSQTLNQSAPFLKLVNINTENILESHHSSWVQDMFIAAQTKKGIVCLYHEENLKWRQNKTLLESLVLEEHISKKICSFNVAGGNIIFLNAQTAFIGKNDLVKRNTNQIDTNKIKRIKSELHLKELHILGAQNSYKNISRRESFQPLYHLDLYFNALHYKNKTIVLLAKIYRDQKDSTNIEIIKNCNFDLNSMETELNTLGFEVHRIPLYYSFGKYYSYNNSIFEIFEDKTFAYVPDYAQNVPSYLKNAFANKMKTLNIEISFVNAKALTGKTGSLHCISKVLKRK